MNLFQWLATPVLCLLALLEVRAYLKNRQAIHLIREVIWCVGLILVLFPDLSSAMARFLGIGRGTDLVLYAFIFLATGAMFHLYGRNYTLRRDVVELVRRDALRDAVIAGSAMDCLDDDSQPPPAEEVIDE